MSKQRRTLYFFKNINLKHRLSLRRQINNSEMWYMHISPLQMIGGFLAMVLIIFIAILTLVVYTPILNLIPGYSGNRMREKMIESIIRVDSIERALADLQLYNDNVILMLDGKTPITRNVHQVGDSMAMVNKAHPTAPNLEDSILRLQMEGVGAYSLSSAVAAYNKNHAETELVVPIKGVVAKHFNPKDGSFGVGLMTAINTPILAIDAGTVILSVWSPEEGHIIQIQHASNLVSIYKYGIQAPKLVGTRVMAGEVIGSTGEGLTGENGKKLFEFQLWQNGVPIDPESYIIF